MIVQELEDNRVKETREEYVRRLLVEVDERNALLKLRDSLAEYEVRKLSWEELCNRIKSLWEDAYAEFIVRRAQTDELDDTSIGALADAVHTLIGVVEELPSREKAWVDRKIIRLTRVLPKDVARKIAEADLDHSRKIRREGAYRTFKSIGVDANNVPRLLTRYLVHRELDALEVIARSPEAVMVADPYFLLSEIVEHYWRMRVVETLIRYDDPRIDDIKRKYPSEYVYAVGRCDLQDQAGEVINLVKEYPTNIRVLSLAAWTFTKLRNADGLAVVKELATPRLQESLTPTQP